MWRPKDYGLLSEQNTKESAEKRVKSRMRLLIRFLLAEGFIADQGDGLERAPTQLWFCYVPCC